MTHEEAIDRLHDLYRGALGDADRNELAAHLSECEDCNARSEAYETIRCAVAGTHDEESDHPMADEIVDAVVDRDALYPEDRDWILSHVGDCPRCSEVASRISEVERRTADLDLESTPATARGSDAPGRRYGLLAIAASILLAVLSYPAYLGLVRLPAANRLVEDLAESRDAGWNGAVELQIVSSALRGVGDPPEIRVEPGQPFVVLGLEVRIPREVPAHAIVTIRLADVAGNEHMSIDLPAGDAREQLRSTGIVTCTVGSGGLRAGLHELSLMRRDRPEEPALFAVPVRVVRRDVP